MTWEPLITEPRLVRRAETVVDRTTRFFAAVAAGEGSAGPDRLTRFLDRITGVDGVPAVALFFGYRALEDGAWIDATSAWLHRAVAVTSRLEEPRPWLMNGVAGCGWVVAHLVRRLEGASDGDPTEDLGEALLGFLTDARGTLDAELTLGLAGLGTYFLEAGSAHGLAEVVDQLAAQADRGPAGITWRKAPSELAADERLEHPAGLYNLGIPHGVPGVIAFLARVVASPASTATARELLEGSVSWLLQQRSPCGASQFPYVVDPVRGPVPAESRLAWCYGDLGIAATLLQAARALGRPAWEAEALDLAVGAAARSATGSGVEDGMVCHGAAGVAHLFNRMYQASGRPALREAAIRWYEATLDHDQPSLPTGYRCLVRDPQDAPTDDAPVVDAESYGLAVGVSGVALALMAGLGTVTPDWDGVLATSVPPAGGVDAT